MTDELFTHPHLEGLIRKWDRVADELELIAPCRSERLHAEVLRQCSDDLRQALSALPGGGVDDEMFERAVKARSKAFYTIPEGTSHHETMRMAERAALTAALSPTPNPHEADQ